MIMKTEYKITEKGVEVKCTNKDGKIWRTSLQPQAELPEVYPFCVLDKGETSADVITLPDEIKNKIKL